MPAASRFWDRMAKRYSRKPVPDEAVYQRKLAITREYLNPGMDVLEIGCGSGLTAISHAPFVRHIHGIDGSARMIEIARDNASAAKTTNATFEHIIIEDSDAAGRFDAVLALSVLHLLDDWRAVIEKVHGMLPVNGIFVSSTACLGNRNILLKAILPLGGKLGLIPGVQFMSSGELLQSLVATGFVIEQQWQPDRHTLFVVARKTARQ